MSDTEKRGETREFRKKKRKRRSMGIVEILLMAVSVCVLAVSLWKLGGILLEYKAGTDAYTELKSYALLKTGEGGEKTEDDFLMMDVDFDALSAINEDFVAWFSMPVLELDYPVVQGEDDEYYLTHTFEGEENSAGAIFMDSAANSSLTDFNTFLYGHNMKNGSMFGKLKQFGRDERLCDSDPYFYLYTRDVAYRYRIISYYVTTDGSSAYFKPATQEEYKAYVQQVLSSTPYDAREPLPEGPMVTLSTCYGQAGGVQRFVVHGVLEETRLQGESEE